LRLLVTEMIGQQGRAFEMRLVELPVWVKFTMSLAPMRRAVLAIELAIASLTVCFGGIEGLAG
jgi:hypothetical protein